MRDVDTPLSFSNHALGDCLRPYMASLGHTK